LKFPHKILAIAAVPLVVALVACGGGDKKDSTSTGSSGAGDQPAATAPSGSSGGSSGSSSNGSSGSSGANNTGGGESVSGDTMAALIENFAKAKSWKAQIHDESDPSSDATFEYVAPNKYHIKSADVEAIVIGGDTYAKMGPTWTKISSGGDTGPFFDPEDLKDSIDEAKGAKVTKGGKDKVNGKDCQIYNIQETDGTTSEVCAANNLPVRIVEDDGESKSTITFTDFNVDFDIKAPI
jgi:hypothetical protein